MSTVTRAKRQGPSLDYPWLWVEYDNRAFGSKEVGAFLDCSLQEGHGIIWFDPDRVPFERVIAEAQAMVAEWKANPDVWVMELGDHSNEERVRPNRYRRLTPP